MTINRLLPLLLLAIHLVAVPYVQAQNNTPADSVPTVRIGYGGNAIGTLAGAVEHVSEQQMNTGLVATSLDALSGRAAGVQVTSSANQEAMIAAVRVRGTTSLTGDNDPLVIIDGVTSDLATLTTIYPADIASFTILKDASETAQYGSRGAAGVIEVATKKGRQQQFTISYDATVGLECVAKRLSVLGADAFRQTAQQLGLTYLDGGQHTDFVRTPERTGTVQHHHVAFGGGNGQAHYRASLGVMDHHSVVRNHQRRNYTAKVDLTQQAFDDHLTVDLGLFGSLQSYSRLPFQQKLFYSAATFNPTLSDRPAADGSYDQVTEALWINNPASLLRMKNDETGSHFNVHLRLHLALAQRLTLTAMGSYGYNTVGTAHFYPTYVWSHGEAYRSHANREELLTNIALDYTAALASSASELHLTLLAEHNNEKETGFYTTATHLQTNDFGYNNLAAGASRPWEGTGSTAIDAHMQSFLLRAQWTYGERLTLTANVRADASSKFGRNHRWGFFPSTSGAWTAWQHPHNGTDRLRLRMGYGLSGSQAGIDSYQSMQLIQPNGIVPLDGTAVATLGLIRNANPDLKWEVKRTLNIGFDLTLAGGRLSLTVDHYRSKTTDMLYDYEVSVPPFPYNHLLANLGALRASGIEIGVGAGLVRQHDWDLNLSLNLTMERNRLLSLNGYYNGQYLTTPDMKGISALWGAGFHGASDVVQQIVGQPLGVFYLPHCRGLVTDDDDGTRHYDIDGNSRVCGQATPKAVLGSNIALRYREWDLTVQANGAFGHKIFNGTALTMMNMQSLPNYNVLAAAPAQRIFDQTISDYWLERGDYLHIDYVTVGWNVPLRSRFIRSLRLSASANNVATITAYSGTTPLINSSVVSSTLGIDDLNTFPVYRSYTMSLSIQF